jgi:uncharacterized protein (TIGR02217 family)
MFLNVRLPDDISYGAVSGIEFITNVTSLANGKECRNSILKYPRNFYVINYDVLNFNMINSLNTFFRMAMGRANSFLFRDWLDFEAKNQVISQFPILTNKLKDEGKTFQLSKLYNLENTKDNPFIRKIVKPVFSTLKIVDDKSKVLVEGEDYTCDYTTGIVTFKELVDNNYKATFDFNTNVRFDSDTFEYTTTSQSICSVKKVRLIEVL